MTAITTHLKTYNEFELQVEKLDIIQDNGTVMLGKHQFWKNLQFEHQQVTSIYAKNSTSEPGLPAYYKTPLDHMMPSHLLDPTAYLTVVKNHQK